MRASLNSTHSSHDKLVANSIFIAHLDLGALNHMSHKLKLFDPDLFKTLLKVIPISLRDDSEKFVTGKGTICLMFNIDGKKKEG